MIRKAVIPAAGFGTRFLPATKSQPKEMLPVVDTPVIQYVVEEAVASGVTDIIMVIGKGKRAIEEHFDRNFELESELLEKSKESELEMIRKISDMADVHFVWQKELKGLGDAIYCARHHVGREPFAVLLGDTVVESERPVTRQLIDEFEARKASIIGLEEIERSKVSRYGVIHGEAVGGGVYRIDDLVEKPPVDKAPSNLVVAGRYVLTPEVFDIIGETERGLNNEIQITDALRELLDQQAMYGLQYDGHRYDIGNKLDFVKTNVRFALERDDMHDDMVAFIREIAEDL